MPTIKSTGYNIAIGEKSFSLLNTYLSKNNYSKYVIICDEHTLEKCLPTLLIYCEKLQEAEIIELESGEDKKTIETCLQVWGALTDIGIDKKSLIINLGGGVITDLGGFIASTFKRGVDFINIPTTLLSMVDASVGGKTGIDFEGIKNHIGTSFQPKGVYINPEFLLTLSTRHIKNGYAEIVKIALIADNEFWQIIKKLNHVNDFCSEEIITRAIALKNNIVKKDMNEKGLRKSLNFGHSIGHAIESSFLEQKKDILHGEAVAAGILVEAIIAQQLNQLSVKEEKEIQAYILKTFQSLSITKKTLQGIMQYIIHDKKNESGKLCFALPKSIGKFMMNESVTAESIEQAITRYSASH